MLNNLLFFVGGIGLFLYGMKLMSDGLQLSAGSRLKKILKALTTNKFLGVLVGFGITTIVQSSTATTVMVVGFAKAGLMNLTQAIGVIIGANIGSTTTGLVIALNIQSIAPICIFIGAVLFLFAKKRRLRHIGMAIAGFGMLFFGIKVMSDAMGSLSDLPWVTTIFQYASNPFIGILIGIALTAIVQSSAASMGILLAAMMAGVVTDLNQAIFILYGQNIGTCLTAILASIGSSKMAKKAALMHLIYNVVGITLIVIITLLPIGFVDFIKGLSSDVSTQFVYAHVVINIIMAAALLPFSNLIIKITEAIIKGEDEEKTNTNFKYIDERLLDTPSFAVVQTCKEVERVAKLALKDFDVVEETVLKQSKKVSAQKIRKNEDAVDFLCDEIIKFLTKLTSQELEYLDVKLVASLYRVVTDIERWGRHSVNIIEAYEELASENQILSKKATEELGDIFATTKKALTKSIEMFVNDDYTSQKMSEIKALEDKVDAQTEQYKSNHIDRLNNGEYNASSGIAFVRILTCLERISDYAYDIAFSLKHKTS